MALTLRVGGKYKTRDGSTIVAISKTFGDRFEGLVGNLWYSWTQEGYRYSPTTISPLDLVEEVSLLIQRGYYRTRAGKKAYVDFSTYDPFLSDAPALWRGYIQGVGGMSWRSDGKGDARHSRTGEPADVLHHDLVDPWKDPLTATVWWYRWPDGTVRHYHCEQVIFNNGFVLIGKGTITINEGDGL